MGVRPAIAYFPACRNLSAQTWQDAAGDKAQRSDGRATGYFLGEKLKNAKCNSPLLNI
jgi:hypothetical protein